MTSRGSPTGNSEAAPAARPRYARHVGHQDTVLLLSFTQRDALADQIAGEGFKVVAARRQNGIVRRFLALDCGLVVLDARGAITQALSAAQALATHLSARNANLLLLYDRADAAALGPFADCGVNAMLPAPWHQQELTLAIALARRQGGNSARIHAPLRQIWWHTDLGDGAITIDSASDNSAVAYFGPTVPSLRGYLAPLTVAARRRATAALRKLRAHGGYAAFAHAMATPDGPGQVVHHLSLAGARLAGHAEIHLNAPPGDDGLAVRAPPLMPLADAMTLAVSAQTDEPADGQGRLCVARVTIDGLSQFRSTQPGVAGDALLGDVAAALSAALRRDLDCALFAAGLGTEDFAFILPGRDDAARIMVELCLLASALERGTLGQLDDTLRLRLDVIACDAGLAARAPDRALPRTLVRPDRHLPRWDLASILAPGSFTILFQPQFAIADNQLSGAEALTRWHHPQLGDLGGATLFAAADLAGDSRAVSLAIWQAAMVAMTAWPPALAGVRVALNVTARDVMDAGTADALIALAARHGIAPARLAVEVTEASAIDAPEPAAATLSRLREAGVHVALDDFGSGFSGLAWLKQLPVDYIKIDAGFTRAATGSARDSALLQGVIDHARTMDIGVLAEGVEQEQQRRLLADMGCRWYQGFLRAPALSSADFQAFVLDGRRQGRN